MKPSIASQLLLSAAGGITVGSTGTAYTILCYQPSSPLPGEFSTQAAVAATPQQKDQAVKSATTQSAIVASNVKPESSVKPESKKTTADATPHRSVSQREFVRLLKAYDRAKASGNAKATRLAANNLRYAYRVNGTLEAATQRMKEDDLIKLSNTNPDLALATWTAEWTMAKAKKG